MEPDLLKKIEEQDHKLEAIYRSVEKTRKYFLWTLIVTLIMVFLPLLGIIFIIPTFISTLTAGYGI